MDIATNSSNETISDPNFARLRLLKGADLDNVEDILAECPVIQLEAQQYLPDAALIDYSLLVLLSGRLEMDDDGSDMPATITAGDYVGGLNPFLSNQDLSGYKAIQESKLVAFDEEMLKSLMMLSHSAAVNISALAMNQLKHMPAANDAMIAEPQAVVKVSKPAETETLAAPKLHDAKWLEELLDRQIIRSLTDQEQLSLAVLEIDDIEKYCEKHGDDSTQYVSNTVARCILDHVRPGDLVARIDECHFVIVLPKASVDDAQLPANRISEKISETEITIPNDCTLPPVTISAGLTQLNAMIGAEKFVADGIEALGRAHELGSGSISD